MKKISTILLLIFAAVVFLQGSSFAQLTGVKTIPGNYATITAAITDLNTQGVGAGGVVFNVAPGYTETGVNVILTCTTNPPNALNPITFQKSGAGVNPLLTAGVGVSTTLDGIFIFNGVTYITIDGIDLQENVANVDATTQMEWGYALLKKSGAVGSQWITIKNSTVTLNKTNVNSIGIYSGNHLTTSTTTLVVTSLLGANSNNKFLSNTVQNCFMGIRLLGYASATPFDFYDQNNEIGNTGALRNQVLNFGNGTSGTSAAGISSTNQNYIKVHHTYVNSTGGADNNALLYGIYISTATNANADIYNDTVTVKGGGTTQNLGGIIWECGTTGNGNTINVYNNVVTGCTYPTATSGLFKGFWNNPSSAATSAYTNVYNNKVLGNTLPGSGEFSGIYLGASGTGTMLRENVYNNVVDGNTKTGTAGNMYMCYVNGSVQQKYFFNNQMTNNSNATSSGLTYGYYNFGVDYGEDIYDNTVANNTGGTGIFNCIEATSGSGPTDKNIYNNTLNGNTGGALVSGLSVGYSTNLNLYKNNIYNLTSTNAAGLAPAVVGINITANAPNQSCLIYNNFISELKAPNATSISSIYGMWLQTTNILNVYYNTIYLNASSTSATFGTSGINYVGTGTTIPLLDLRNNIIVNVSTPGATGRTVAFQRATTNLTNYNILSGNNCYYAGTPSTTNLIHFDGTNSDQTIQVFKDRMGARDQASFTEIPPFVNVGASPYNLHIQTGIATQCEKGAQPLTAVNVDYDGTLRNASFPDVGADEFAGITNDIASPLIVFNAVGNGSVASSRSLPSFATITDPSGVNTTAGTRPRIYYKKSTNANTIADNTSGTDGWKWVEATNTSSPFSFTIDYTILFGGSVAAADVIQYFVIAQDLNGTPRIGNNAGAFALQPTSVALGVANTPIGTTNTNSYTISATAPLSGAVTVGTLGGETFSSLTNAGGLFATINAASLSGNLIVNITSDLTAELGTTALNKWSEIGTGGYTVTIVPSSASVKTISGTVASSLVRLDGATNVTIDGRFGGSGSYLLFRNLNTTNADLQFLNDAQNNVVRNCIFESANTSTTSGAIVLGTTTKSNGNDNNIITYNEIRNRTDVVAFYAQGIYCAGTVTTLPQFNNNCTISNNNIHDFFIDGGIQQGGIVISTGNTGFNIDSNSIYQTATRTMTVTGALGFGIFISNTASVATVGGFNVRKNYIGGSAPLCGGTPLTWTVSSTTQLLAFNGIRLVGGQLPSFVTDNTIANFDLTANNTATNNFIFLGIGTGNGIWNMKRNTIGAPVGNDNIKITLNIGGAGLNIIRGIYMGHFTATVGFGGTIDSNTVGSITVGGTTTVNGGYFEGVGIGGNAFLVNSPSISYNLIGSTTTANSIRFTYATAATNLRLMSCFLVSQTVTINANTWQNITDFSTGASNLWSLLNGSPGNVTHIVTNNTWSDISTASSAALGNTQIIYLTSVSPNEVISGNTMKNISLTNTGPSNGGLCGIITFGSNNIGGTFSKNKIYNMNNLQTGTSPGVYGAYFNVGADWNVSNNMIALTNGEPLDMARQNELSQDNHVNVPYVDHAVYNVIPGYESTVFYKPAQDDKRATEEQIFNVEAPDMQNSVPQRIQQTGKGDVSSTNGIGLFGIVEGTNGGMKTFNYNSVYIGGSTSAAINSYGFVKLGTGNVSLRNNLFYNNRSGLGVHYAIGNDATVPSTGWLTNASDYNAFVTSDSTAVGSWGLTSQSIDQWRTSSAGDNKSWYAKNSVITPANLFTSIATGNLNINTGNGAAWLVSGKGIALPTFNTDFNGNARQTAITGGCTDIGANEFAATPPSNPVALQSAAPSSGGTTDYVLYGRKIASITWGTGGTYPTSMNVNYFSGVTPLAPNVSNPQRVSNSYWTANAVGTFSGTTYDMTYYYGDNETFSITSPTTNILMAKNDNTFWMSYPRGTGSLQTEQNNALMSATTRGLYNFSSFTLCDASLAAERPLTPLYNATGVATSVSIVWNKSLLAANYKVQLSTDSLFGSFVVNDLAVVDTFRAVTGLTAGTKYFWRVRGANGPDTGAWCQTFKFTTTAVLPPAVVNLNVIPGGFYNTGTGRLNMKDTVRVYLVDSVTCLKVDSAKGVVDSVSFGTSISFSNAATGNYYMLVYHRNHLAVATRFKTAITRGSTVGYNFTTDSAKAYGFNMVKVSNSPVRWGMLPGDANRDGFSDGLDQTIWITQSGLDGYLSADFNGDTFVDGFDQTVWIVYGGNSSFLPCGFFLDPVTGDIKLNTADHDAKQSNKILYERKNKSEQDSKLNQNNR